MLSSPSGMTVSTRALTMLADALRHRRTQLRTRGRYLDAGPRQSRHVILKVMSGGAGFGRGGVARRRCW
jgi:hypothetical protein